MHCMISECKMILKTAILMTVVLCLLVSSSVSLYAQTAVSAEPETVGMYIDGAAYSGRAVLYNDTTYIDLFEFSRAVYPCSTSYAADTRTAQLTGEDITLTATDGETYISANDRYLWCPSGVFTDGSYLFVPLRVAAKALGAQVDWNADEFAAYVTVTGNGPLAHASDFYVEDELYWLSRIIYAEAGAEPFDGQIAVGNVVLNRVREEIFPSNIYDVIFDRKYGVQFTPTANGMIYREPSEESVIAAKICLEGYSISYEILYFINAALAENFWVPQNRPYVMTISGHDFYS
ncbi:MAG: cell wall hydrolase [Clostridia bacterium]|nr:cell wall hydrolase [Clostridia bacterium]